MPVLLYFFHSLVVEFLSVPLGLVVGKFVWVGIAAALVGLLIDFRLEADVQNLDLLVENLLLQLVRDLILLLLHDRGHAILDRNILLPLFLHRLEDPLVSEPSALNGVELLRLHLYGRRRHLRVLRLALVVRFLRTLANLRFRFHGGSEVFWLGLCRLRFSCLHLAGVCVSILHWLFILLLQSIQQIHLHLLNLLLLVHQVGNACHRLLGLKRRLAF